MDDNVGDLLDTLSDTDVRSAARLVTGARDVTLLAHVQPDADALGAAAALGLALRDRGAAVRVSFGAPDEIPESLRDLDPGGLFVPAARVPMVSPLLITVDVASLDRLGPLADRVAATTAAGGSVLVIDHHVSNTRFGTHHLVDDGAESTTVIVLRLLDELGIPLTEPVARCLYAGLLTDTSSFRRATPATHEVAARLLAAGVDAAATARSLLDNHAFGWLRLLSVVLGRAALEPEAAHGLGLVHTAVRRADMAGLRPDEVDSVIDIVRAVTEAEVAAVFKEVGEDRWSASIRAVGRVDVSDAAVRMGGGGHRLAAGFTARGALEEILVEFRAALSAAAVS